MEMSCSKVSCHPVSVDWRYDEHEAPSETLPENRERLKTADLTRAAQCDLSGIEGGHLRPTMLFSVLLKYMHDLHSMGCVSKGAGFGLREKG
jgi:hypothetical protein